MFGLFNNPVAHVEPPKDVPPPTPVNFPHYAPEIVAHGASGASASPQTSTSAGPAQPTPTKKSRLTDVLQGIVRPTELQVKHFQALGVRIHEGADAATLIPNGAEHLPDFAAWDEIPYDQARNINETTRRPISNGNRSPGILVYLDRKRELSTNNTDAYRTVRRIQAPKPVQPVRLGNAYEFFRHLDNYSSFWDDTTAPPTPPSKPDEDKPLDASTDKKMDDGKAVGDGDAVTESAKDATPAAATTTPDFVAYRTSTGSLMPPEFRLNMVTTFIKLVAYDFGCNVTAPRAEPRLYLNTGTVTVEEAEAQDQLHKDVCAEAQKAKEVSPGQPASEVAAAAVPVAAPPAVSVSVPASVKYKGPCSYFSSGCIFIFRSPTTREAARAGIVEGPLAAVSARHTTSFGADIADSPDMDRDSCIDLARELVAALVTAQHRARQGRAERRVGKGAWWATKPRWGGGPGGPIGREVDSALNTDDVPDMRGGEGSLVQSTPTKPGGIPGGGNPTNYSGINTLAGITGFPSSTSSSTSTSSSRSGSAKKQRKGAAVYDNYRMVRPPSSSWDKKTRYEAIGRDSTKNYDDIFVVSSLFHHVSIVRVRVPQRLLEELDGADGEDPSVADAALRGLEVHRSPWYDLFQPADRLAALRLTWGMMAYLMRQEEAGDKDKEDKEEKSATTGEDVPMKDS